MLDTLVLKSRVRPPCNKIRISPMHLWLTENAIFSPWLYRIHIQQAWDRRPAAIRFAAGFRCIHSPICCLYATARRQSVDGKKTIHSTGNESDDHLFCHMICSRGWLSRSISNIDEFKAPVAAAAAALFSGAVNYIVNFVRVSLAFRPIYQKVLIRDTVNCFWVNSVHSDVREFRPPLFGTGY